LIPPASHYLAIIIDATGIIIPVEVTAQDSQVLHGTIGIRIEKGMLSATGSVCPAHHLTFIVEALSGAFTTPQGAQVMESVGLAGVRRNWRAAAGQDQNQDDAPLPNVNFHFSTLHGILLFLSFSG
jgi:hypothetical protein